jgi:two-component system LytT family response regulator
VELENNQSAFDLINKLDRNLYRPYIILVTAYPQYSIEAIKNEVFDYIIKPVDIDELKVLVDRLLQHMSMKTNQMLNKFDMLSK